MGYVGLAQKQLAQADDIAAMWPDGFWHAAVIETRGTLSRARGDETEAARLFLDAADRYAGLNRPVDEARCHARGASAPVNDAGPTTMRMAASDSRGNGSLLSGEA